MFAYLAARPVIAAGLSVGAVIVVVTVWTHGGAGEKADGAKAAADSSAALDRGAMGCVEEYNLERLAGRSFAFDGTVVDIADPASSDMPDDPYIDVTFHVNEWFRGSDAAQVEVAVFAPGAVTSVDAPAYAIGDRLLVSGEPRWGGAPLDEPVAWACGFTRTYHPDTVAAWRAAMR